MLRWLLMHTILPVKRDTAAGTGLRRGPRNVTTSGEQLKTNVSTMKSAPAAVVPNLHTRGSLVLTRKSGERIFVALELKMLR